MSLSASVKLVRSVVNAGQPVHVLFTITNPDGADVGVTACTPVVDKTAAGNFPPLALHPATTTTVTASGGTLTFPWACTFFTDFPPASSGSDSVGCHISCVFATDDGAVTYGDIVTARIVPTHEPPVQMPVEGQLRLDECRNSYLRPIVLVG